VLYDVSSGGPREHGRLAIANGAVKSSNVKAARREISVRPSNSRTMQNMSRENGTTMSCKWKARARES
jgi:hypothetical protein